MGSKFCDIYMVSFLRAFVNNSKTKLISKIKARESQIQKSCSPKLSVYSESISENGEHTNFSMKRGIDNLTGACATSAKTSECGCCISTSCVFAAWRLDEFKDSSDKVLRGLASSEYSDSANRVTPADFQFNWGSMSNLPRQGTWFKFRVMCPVDLTYENSTCE